MHFIQICWSKNGQPQSVDNPGGTSEKPQALSFKESHELAKIEAPGSLWTRLEMSDAGWKSTRMWQVKFKSYGVVGAKKVY